MKIFLLDLWHDLREKRLCAGGRGCSWPAWWRSPCSWRSPPKSPRARAASAAADVRGKADRRGARRAGQVCKLGEESGRPGLHARRVRPGQSLHAAQGRDQEGQGVSPRRRGAGPGSTMPGTRLTPPRAATYRRRRARRRRRRPRPATPAAAPAAGGSPTTTVTYKYVVDVTFSANGRTRRIQGLEKLDMLPNEAVAAPDLHGRHAQGRRRGVPGGLDARRRRRGPLQAEPLRLRVRVHRRRRGARLHRGGRATPTRCGSTRSAR